MWSSYLVLPVTSKYYPVSWEHELTHAALQMAVDIYGSINVKLLAKIVSYIK